jgi:SAM-dependent methyltransferase
MSPGPLPPLDPAAEEAELHEYLGDGYDRRRLESYHEQLERELAEIGDEQELYRRSEAYLYNLTAFAMTGTKEPYLEALVAAVPPPARVLDYGCGIGADGLRLIAAGYEVAFADFDNPSTRYLRWRLERRGAQAAIYDLDREAPPAGHDLAFSFDVIEHVADPFAFLSALERSAGLVLVNVLEPVTGETDLHHDLPVAALLRHAAARRPRRYALHHGRSHLMLYGAGLADPLAWLRLRRAAARLS